MVFICAACIACIKGTIQQAPRMRVLFIYFCLNMCKLYDGPIRLHDFTVRCGIQVESIARGRWMYVPLKSKITHTNNYYSDLEVYRVA